MTISALAGKPVPKELLINTPRVVVDYYTEHPEPGKPEEKVSFGTSGHRGSSVRRSFNEDHILAIAQAVCDYRNEVGHTGPLFVGMDTHALSEPAFITTMEVLIANGVDAYFQSGRGYTPTPVISHALICYNRQRSGPPADGMVITPSHNPPADGGIKYDPPSGGPADTHITKKIQELANNYLQNSLKGIKRVAHPLKKATAYDYIEPYVNDLINVVDLKVVAASGLKIGVDPMGGSGLAYWEPIAEKYGLNIEVVNQRVDPTFSFMTLDWDGAVRMDCSSPYAMAGLIALKERFDIAFGNDPDYDRHGIVTPKAGLMNPNHYLAVAIDYLFSSRSDWSKNAAVGKTLVSSAMIDRVAAGLGRKLYEVPVGFKWFVDCLLDGSCAFGGEESAGAAFLRMNGQTWTTDKDGFIMDLLAAEITAVTGQDPYERYMALTNKYGNPIYERQDAKIAPEQKKALANMSPEIITEKNLAGEPIQAILTKAPGNQAEIGGIKIVAENGWFAARPSGTEDIYKIYAESFKGQDHLRLIQKEAQEIVNAAFANSK